MNFITDDGVDVRTLSTAELSEEIGRAGKAKEWSTLEVCSLEMNRRDRAARAKRTCTCLGSCKGSHGLAPGWACALETR